MLVKKDQPCAKEFLKSSDRLTIGELNIINRCDQYTLEGVIVHGLGLLFNSVESALSVRILTLVEQLNNMAKILVKLLSERIIGNVDLAALPGGDDGDDKKLINIGILFERKMICITHGLTLPGKTIDVQNSGLSYYKMKASYVWLDFDMRAVPMQLRLPMRDRGENQSVRGIVQGYVSVKDEEYSDTVLTEIYLRIYYDENISSVEKNISVEQLALLIEESINDDDVYEPIALTKLDNHKHKYLMHMTRLKANYKERRGFIIVNIEMFLVEPDTILGELNSRR
ncbi:hypothetical protein BC332_23083 [Capsicum chinense]|nr:hypothetical protein BC332_23083 [Capsicum chinense]